MEKFREDESRIRVRYLMLMIYEKLGGKIRVDRLNLNEWR